MPKTTKKKTDAVSRALSHYDSAGNATMVDVSAKAETRREAEASAFVEMSPQVLASLPSNPKGNPLEIARFAGISAAKRTAELIPMCHQLPLSFIDVTTRVCENGVQIHSREITKAQPGVEMEPRWRQAWPLSRCMTCARPWIKGCSYARWSWSANQAAKAESTSVTRPQNSLKITVSCPVISRSC